VDNPQRLVGKLILYIVDQIQNQGVRPSLIMLTKLLYLVDVEHYRRYGKPLTGLQWVYQKYGPWAFSLPTVLRHADIDLGEEEFVTSKGHKGRAFFAVGRQDITGAIGSGSKLIVDRVIQAWALEGTNTLLGYVYFQTEPMIHGTRGEALPFDTIVRDVAEDRIPRKVSTEKAADVRSSLLQALARTTAGLVAVADQRDEAYLTAMRLMDAEGTFRFPAGDAPDGTPEALELLAGLHD